MYEWKKKYSEFSEALKRGKEVIDRQVENALLKRALGYEYVEETWKSMEDPITGEQILGLDERKVKYQAPDTTAQIFWLKNRKPNEWRDKQQVEHSGEVNTHNPLAALTTEELRKLIDK